MNGTNFFLGMNFVIALSFSAVFFVVSTRSRYTSGVRWIAAGFAIAALSAIFELSVAHTEWVRTSAIAAFASVLAGLMLLRIGVGQLYGERINLPDQVMFFLFWVIVDLVIYDLPRGTVLHAFAYQAPFALVAFSSTQAILRSARRLLSDRALAGLLALTGFHFVAKAGLAVAVGAGTTAKDYINSNYAIISQSATGVMVVAVGLMLLTVLVLEIMADERSRSETDSLSALFNRRGFENQVTHQIKRSPVGPHMLMMCDLDHFKRINDTYGHYCGDRVIEAFSQLLTANAPADAVTGRLGGEEFALFLPRTSLESAILFADDIRRQTSAMAVPGLPNDFRMTASFGVTRWEDGMPLHQNLRRSDQALYEAKKAGRDCVRWSTSEVSDLSIAAQ